MADFEEGQNPPAPALNDQQNGEEGGEVVAEAPEKYDNLTPD